MTTELQYATMQSQPSQNPFEVARHQFNIAADYLGLDPGSRKVLSSCKRELTVNFPVQMDDGSVEVFTGIEYSII